MTARRRGRSGATAAALAAVLALAAGCGGGGGDGDGGTGPQPAFPDDYTASYTQVRSCRQSSAHGLNRVRVLADPAALEPYMNRDAPFPTGAVVVKEEYQIDDLDCSGGLVQWTVMQRLAGGSSPDTLDWHWQQVGPDRTVMGEDLARCINCHSGCDAAAGGYYNTCSIPP